MENIHTTVGLSQRKIHMEGIQLSNGCCLNQSGQRTKGPSILMHDNMARPLGSMSPEKTLQPHLSILEPNFETLPEPSPTARDMNLPEPSNSKKAWVYLVGKG